MLPIALVSVLASAAQAPDRAALAAVVEPVLVELVARPGWRFGEVCAFGGMFSSARDLSRYVIALLAGGESGPFTDATRALLFTPTVWSGTDQKMGLAWFVDHPGQPHETIRHGGEVDSYSANLVLRREARVGLIVLANRGGDSAERLSRAIVGQVLPGWLAPPK